MGTTHFYILHAAVGDGEMRHAVHLCDEQTNLLRAMGEFLHAAGRPQLSDAHVLALTGGPQHPAFKMALEQLRLSTSAGCPPSIVHRTIEMLIASEMMPPTADDDELLRMALYATFSTEDDWEHFARSSQIATLAYLTHFEAISDDWDKHSKGEQILITQIASAICVAIIQARAELQRELTTQGSF